MMSSFLKKIGAPFVVVIACGPVDATSSDASTTGGEPSTTAEIPTTSSTSGGPEPTGDDGTTVDPSDGTTGGPEACVDLTARTVGVLEANCAKCHGAGSVGQGGIDYILDLDALIENGKVVPGAPEGSRIYQRMSSVDLPMPPPSESQRPSEGDIAAVHDWIAECAGQTGCPPAAIVGIDEVLAMIAHDLDGASVSVEAFPFTRYLSFVHLANAGLCDAEIEVHREALAKLVNSLSQGVLIKAPVAIDERRLVYRIDIRDYGWDTGPVQLSEPTFHFNSVAELDKIYADTWEMIADQNPYSVTYPGAQAMLISSDTQTQFPVLQADAFIDVTSRAPLYYDILGVPTRLGRLRAEDPPCAGDECLESQLGLDLLGDIESEQTNDDGVTARAGFRVSDISDFNRVLERHEFPNADNRSLWLAYDFGSQNGDADISAHPLDFEFDASALLFGLPNGLQGYMLADEAGDRINEGFVNIIRDESQQDFLVRAGVSCMGCHSAGIIRANDEVRFDLDNGQSEVPFTDEQKDRIRALYPSREDMDALQQEDIARFTAALEQCGVSAQSEREPVITAFLEFGQDVDINRAAAELGLEQADLQLLIGKLSADLLELGKGGVVQRGDFSPRFGQSVCLLGLGTTRCCPVSPDMLEPGCEP